MMKQRFHTRDCPNKSVMKRKEQQGPMNFRIKLFSALLSLMVVSGLAGYTGVEAQTKTTPKQAATIEKPAEKSTVEEKVAENIEYMAVAPLDLLKAPAQYLDKHIQFEGTFNRFSDMGLDYKKAFKDSRDYVNLMILRPDVKQHQIPLSELKMFFPRKKSDEVVELETGDRISVKGHVFSTALNEPWVDVTEIKVIKKNDAAKKKGPDNDCC